MHLHALSSASSKEEEPPSDTGAYTRSPSGARLRRGGQLISEAFDNTSRTLHELTIGREYALRGIQIPALSIRSRQRSNPWRVSKATSNIGKVVPAPNVNLTVATLPRSLRCAASKEAPCERVLPLHMPRPFSSPRRKAPCSRHHCGALVPARAAKQCGAGRRDSVSIGLCAMRALYGRRNWICAPPQIEYLPENRSPARVSLRASSGFQLLDENFSAFGVMRSVCLWRTIC